MAHDYGLKISLPGHDVTSTNVQDYAVWSKYPLMQTYLVGTASFSIPTEAFSQANHTIITVTHNLGYTPYCTLYWQQGGDYGADYWYGSNGGAGGSFELINFNVDTTTFQIIYIYGGAGSPTALAGTSWSFKFYIFVQQGTP